MAPVAAHRKSVFGWHGWSPSPESSSVSGARSRTARPRGHAACSAAAVLGPAAGCSSITPARCTCSSCASRSTSSFLPATGRSSASSTASRPGASPPRGVPRLARTACRKGCGSGGRKGRQARLRGRRRPRKRLSIVQFMNAASSPQEPVDYRWMIRRSRSRPAVVNKPGGLGTAQAVSLSAGKSQRICPESFAYRRGSPGPGAFRKMIDVWAVWIIVQHVH